MTNANHCPILAGVLADGAEIHLPSGRKPSASTLGRFAAQVGIAYALTFVPVPGHAADPTYPVASSPVPGLPVMAAPDPIELAASTDSVRTPMDPDAWPLRGSLDDDRIRFGPVRVRREIAEIIVEAANETGADPEIMMAMADKESSFDPLARTPTSTAVGLYQFLNATWFEVLKKHGPKHGLNQEADAIQFADGKYEVKDSAERARILQLREDPRLATLMAGENHMADKAMLGSRLGSPPTRAEAYMAHMLGMNGASRLIQAKNASPHVPAKRLFPKAADANRAIFHEGRRARTTAQVHQVVTGQIDKRLSFYSDVAARLVPSRGFGFGR